MMLDIAFVIPRAVIGLLLAGHGAQKLFGWFGGYGLTRTADYLAGLGIRPARAAALLVGLAELAGGAGLALGLATPMAAAAITAVMLGAITLVHWPRVWASDGGFEYALAILAVAALFGVAGPGNYALDALLGIALPMPQTYVAGFAAAIALVLLMHFLRQSEAEQQRRAPSAA